MLNFIKNNKASILPVTILSMFILVILGYAALRIGVYRNNTENKEQLKIRTLYAAEGMAEYTLGIITAKIDKQKYFKTERIGYAKDPGTKEIFDNHFLITAFRQDKGASNKSTKGNIMPGGSKNEDFVLDKIYEIKNFDSLFKTLKINDNDISYPNISVSYKISTTTIKDTNLRDYFYSNDLIKKMFKHKKDIYTSLQEAKVLYSSAYVEQDVVDRYKDRPVNRPYFYHIDVIHGSGDDDVGGKIFHPKDSVMQKSVNNPKLHIEGHENDALSNDTYAQEEVERKDCTKAELYRFFDENTPVKSPTASEYFNNLERYYIKFSSRQYLLTVTATSQETKNLPQTTSTVKIYFTLYETIPFFNGKVYKYTAEYKKYEGEEEERWGWEGPVEHNFTAEETGVVIKSLIQHREVIN